MSGQKRRTPSTDESETSAQPSSYELEQAIMADSDEKRVEDLLRKLTSKVLELVEDARRRERKERAFERTVLHELSIIRFQLGVISSIVKSDRNADQDEVRSADSSTTTL